jgi:hypothetical protein
MSGDVCAASSNGTSSPRAAARIDRVFMLVSSPNHGWHCRVDYRLKPSESNKIIRGQCIVAEPEKEQT